MAEQESEQDASEGLGQEVEEQPEPGYGKYLFEGATEAQRNYDKTLIALAGGALGVSFAFVDKFIVPARAVEPGLLFWAWICWAGSLMLSLSSFLVSRLAFQWAIKEYYAGRMALANPGGKRTVVTWCFTILAGATFLTGVLLMAFFAAKNLEVLK